MPACGEYQEHYCAMSQTGTGPAHIPNRKGASPYPQLEKGRSISPTGKGPCKKRDTGSISKVAQKDARHVPNTHPTH